ncbi:cobalamin binding intrinsic factor-like [Ruditapes philippinarum]|uniref:cobalamin binding intrinsic factor-like n=1 Tax=Ruditapes philippinarum TaxID=129788 RepID=UPI00295C28DE|nr:cobalamin binding intrinsic factor-like [Ruditapes philippinarum]
MLIRIEQNDLLFPGRINKQKKLDDSVCVKISSKIMMKMMYLNLHIVLIIFCEMWTTNMFSLRINNQLVEPYFNHTYQMKIKGTQALIFYMEQAVMTHRDTFKSFKATFYSPYGLYINGINNLEETYTVNRTFWMITNASLPIDLSVNFYIPTAGDEVLLNFTRND